MRKIQEVPFQMGKYVFTPPKFDAEGNQKTDPFITWHYLLDNRNATASMDPLAFLQQYQCAVKMRSDVGEWTGTCLVKKFEMVPNALEGESSLLKGSLEFNEGPEKLYSLSELWIRTLKHNNPSIEVTIELLQPGLEA